MEALIRWLHVGGRRNKSGCLQEGYKHPELPSRLEKRKEKKNFVGSALLPISTKEKGEHWLTEP